MEEPEKRHQEAFNAAADAAERWALSLAGELPVRPRGVALWRDPVPKSEWKAYFRTLQRKILANPAIPPFHEFYMPDLDNARAVTSSCIELIDSKQGKLSAEGDAPLTVAYSNESDEGSRAHEWVHITDFVRLGIVDGHGRGIRPMTFMEVFFTELRGQAMSYLFLKNYRVFGPGNFRDYWESRISAYPWGKAFGEDFRINQAKGNEILKNTAKDCGPYFKGRMEYKRTIVP